MSFTIKQILCDLNSGVFLGSNWPMDVRAVLASMRMPRHVPKDRRRQNDRALFEVEAILEFIDGNGNPKQSPVYTRDICEGGIGLITTTRLEAGQPVTLAFSCRDGMPRKLSGSIRRCKQFTEGWYDLLIREEQPKPPAPEKKQASRSLLAWAGFGQAAGAKR